MYHPRMPDPITRREFLQVTAAAGAFASVGSVQPAGQPDDWFDGPMRWVQLTLVENDPGSFDPQFWLDYFRRLHADAATLSAGGIVAYYPTAIPLHHRSAWLGDTDPFGTLVRGCRAQKMAVVARVDPHAVRNDVKEAHPDWISAAADGAPRRHWANPDLWVTCALGPYNFEFMDRVNREIVAKYAVDGVFANRWAPQGGDCYCVHCQENFRRATGRDLPVAAERSGPTRRAFVEWRIARLTELWKHWDAGIRSVRAASRFIPNGPPDMKTAAELADIQFADFQARRGLMPPWANGRRAKEFRAVMGRKPVAGIFSVGVEEPYRWKDSVQTEPEVQLWVADATANGMRPWVTKFSGVLYDRRWLPIVERIYDWHYRHERYLRNERSLARVALLHSEQTETFHAGIADGDRAGDHVLGMYQALVEARVPFDLVHEALLTPERLDPYKVLVLADAAALSDAQCDAIRKYAQRGGSIVATFATSLFDEYGVRRQDFGLGDVFGVTFGGGITGPMHNSYLTLESDASGRRHQILAGLDGTPRIINGVFRLDVSDRRAEPGPIPPLTLIPQYPDLPMEDVYPRVPHTDTPAVFLRDLGRSRVVYFPWDIDRTFWDVLATDHLQLLKNAVAWAANEPAPVDVGGPGVLDVTLFRQRASTTVHLVNLTNPMMMKGPLRETIPVGPFTVRVRLADGRRPSKVSLLTAGTTPATRIENGLLRVDVPSVGVHEVIAVDD
jgi:hypothetical protein